MALLLNLGDIDEAPWVQDFRAALPGYRVIARADRFEPSDIRYLFVWKPGPDAFEGLSNLKAVFSLGAGVDAILAHPRLPEGVPVVRFVDAALTRCMTDYVVAQITMHQRLFSRFRNQQRRKLWNQFYPEPSSSVAVGIMGLGELGRDAAEKLLALGFRVNGWARSPRTLAGVTVFSGPEAFSDFLSASDMLVNLLPLTEETRGILNYQTFSRLRRGLAGGPVVINAARGGHQVEADIVRALRDGTLAAASLDVFETEPLPPESPLWELRNCFVTPHIAGIADRQAGIAYVARMLRAHEGGAKLENVVDRARGY